MCRPLRDRRLLAGALTVFLASAGVGPLRPVGPPVTHAPRFSIQQTITAPDAAVLDLGSQLSIEVWVFAVADQSFEIVWRGDANGQPFLGIHVDELGNPWLNGYDGVDTWSGFTFDQKMPLRRWVHLAATLDGDVGLAYLDGQPAGTGLIAGPKAPFTSPWRMGSSLSALAEVRLWSRVLSPEEVAAHFATPPSPDSPGLAAYWPLDDAEGQVARDLTAHLVDATLGHSGLQEPVDPVWGTLDAIAREPRFSRELQSMSPSRGGSYLTIPFDFDHDGDSDLVFVGALRHEDFTFEPPFYDENDPPNQVRAYRNDEGTFVEDTTAVIGAQPPQFVHPRDWTTADVNGDTWLDLVVVDHGPDGNLDPPPPDYGPSPGAQARVFLGTSDGRLVDETSARLPTLRAFTHAVSAGDIDGDLDVDLYMANIAGPLEYSDCGNGPPFDGLPCPVFYINDGTGHFTADYSRLPAIVTDTTLGNFPVSELFDADGDLDLDLWVGASHQSRDILFLNDGSGQFTPAPEEALPLRSDGPTGSCVGDVDASGRLDLLVLDPTNNLIRLYLNDGSGVFFDASERVEAILSDPATGVWPVFCELADLDFNGRLDAVITGASSEGGASQILLQNEDDRLVSTTPFSGDLGFGVQFSVARVDGNEAPDLLSFSDFGDGTEALGIWRQVGIFSDGFESGDTCGWSATGGGCL